MEKSLRALIIGFCVSLLLAIFKFLGAEFPWNFVLLPFLIPLSLLLVLIINIVTLDGIDEIKREMENKRR